jgi:hypothetical protein
VGEGRTAGARLTYRVLTSAYHDGTRMGAADVLYALAFAFRWGAGTGPDQDGEVRRATRRLRDALLGVRIVRTETDVLRFGDVVMKYEVPVVEVYLAHARPDPFRLAVLAPPWSPLPWHVVTLLEEAVRRGVGVFSAEEARRRKLPWLDVVRDARQRARLDELLGRLESEGHVPPALRGHVTAREARQRWAALARFAHERKHVLVTSGPYAIHAWSARGGVLRVFRDFSYPLGVGSFNRYPLPLRGAITRAEVRPDRIEVHGEAQRVERFAREHRLVTEPVGSPAVQKERGAAAECRYVIVGADGIVVQAGTVGPTATGAFVVSRQGLRGGPHTALVAIVVNGNVTHAPTRTLLVE